MSNEAKKKRKTDCLSNWEKLYEAVGLFHSYGFFFEPKEEYMTKLHLYLQNGVFKPASSDDWEKVHSLKKDMVYSCTIRNDRNYELLKKYHKMFETAWAGLNEKQSAIFSENPTAFRHSVEMKAGCVEPIFDFDTMDIRLIHKSVSFESMSEPEFQEVFERVKDVLINVVFRKCQDQDFLDIINEF